MGNAKRNFMTIGQIDATGVRGPHEKELEDISNVKSHSFISLGIESLKKFVETELGGKIENIGFNEDWTITVEMFPEVNIHMSFIYLGDEFGVGKEAEFKYYFSGDRVSWVPGEDSATFIDIAMDFLEKKIKNQTPFEKSYDKKTELMLKVLAQRSSPFKFLKEEEKGDLAEFLGAKIWKTTDGWRIRREMFPNIFVEILWDTQKGLDIKFSGDMLSKNLSSYHAELIGIFTINHILRFITIKNEDKELPDICYLMFSRFYTKLKNWDHRRR